MLFEQKDLDVAKSLYGDDIEKSERFARSIHKLRESRKKYDDKREKYKIKFIDTVPEQKLENRTKVNTCIALTLTGKKCNFRASCGKYCKKHSTKI